MTETEALIASLIIAGIIAGITTLVAIFKPHKGNIHVGKK